MDQAGYGSAYADIYAFNNTGFVVDIIDVKYDMFVYNDTDTQYYADLEFTKDGLYIDPIIFDTPGAADGSPSWIRTELAFTLELPVSAGIVHGEMITPLAPGESIRIGWSLGGLDEEGTGFLSMGLFWHRKNGSREMQGGN